MKKPREKRRKGMTIGDAVRKHMMAEDVGTDKALKFLKLPNDGRFDTAGMYYAAALGMLNELANTLEGMVVTVLKTSLPANQPPDQESEKAIIRAQELLREYGFRMRITKIVFVKKPKKK